MRALMILVKYSHQNPKPPTTTATLKESPQPFFTHLELLYSAFFYAFLLRQSPMITQFAYATIFYLLAD